MDASLGLIFFAVMFAGFLQTITGFGYALAAVPLLMFFMNPKDAVMLVLITGVFLKALMIYRTRTDGNFRDIMPLFVASVIGALPGSYVLKVASDETAKIFVGVILVIAALAMAREYHVEFKRPKLVEGLVGITSGFLGSTTSFSGPPIVFYMLNDTSANKDNIRANLARFFVLGNIVSIVLGYYFGTLHLAQLTTDIIISLPALVIGFWLGDKLFSRMDAAAFRRLALWVISLSGLMSVGSGLWPYLHL